MKPWFRDPETRRLIALRYLPRLAGLSVIWEIAQLPLYTIWQAKLIIILLPDWNDLQPEWNLLMRLQLDIRQRWDMLLTTEWDSC